MYIVHYNVHYKVIIKSYNGQCTMYIVRCIIITRQTVQCSLHIIPGDRRGTSSQVSVYMSNTLGISMNDEVSITGALDRIIERSKQLIDVSLSNYLLKVVIKSLNLC